MKILRFFFLAFAIISASLLLANKYSDYQFNQDRMMMTSYGHILILSSFDDTDHLTSYSEYGTRLWNVAFYPKILSWQLKDGLLFIFSKSRTIDSTYLTCIDPLTGNIIWERP